MSSKSKRVTVSVCSDLDAARIETEYGDYLVDGVDNIVASLSEAYRDAQDAGDEKTMNELHSIRQTISETLSKDNDQTLAGHSVFFWDYCIYGGINSGFKAQNVSANQHLYYYWNYANLLCSRRCHT